MYDALAYLAITVPWAVVCLGYYWVQMDAETEVADAS